MQCPVCASQLDVSQQAFEAHVNTHFDEAVGGSSTHSGPGKPMEARSTDATCFVCSISLDGLSEDERQQHVNVCLDGAPEEVTEDSDWSPTSRDHSFWENQPVDKGDRWWDPSVDESSALPTNFSPGVIKTLATVLATTHARRVTRSAVLCHPGVVHMQGVWMFDKIWGCGYRNTLMALSALLQKYPSYRPVFAPASNGSAPGVRRIQGWIEEAWAQGFDEEGREQLRGKLVGTRKWIGVSDIAAMFIAKGIPCELYDFPKPKKNVKTGKPTHQVLQEWVVAYFNDSQAGSSGTAYDVLMSSSAIKESDKMPLILQHSGHSRTIIGYEVNNRGDTNLLLFDPAKAIPKDIRKSSIDHPTLNSNGKRESSSPSPVKKQKLDLAPDEEADKNGWIRKKSTKVVTSDWQSDPVKALKSFRLNLNALSSHTEYQILAFPGGPILSTDDRAARKRLESKVV